MRFSGQTGGTGFNEGPYSIVLTGAEFCETTISVETSSWGQIKSLYR